MTSACRPAQTAASRPGRFRADATDRDAGILAAADIYVALTTERADRPPSSGGYAATELRRLASQGVHEPTTVEAVLTAAGHGEPPTPTSRRAQHAGGLTGREVEVLRLAARDSRRERSPTGSMSPRRPPTTISSTSTQDRGIDASRRRPVGDATRRGQVSWARSLSRADLLDSRVDVKARRGCFVHVFDIPPGTGDAGTGDAGT
jgi:hypothetical protein